MLARDGDTRRMHDVRLDAAGSQPTRQPEPVAAGFEGDRDAGDGLTCLCPFVAPAMQQRQQQRLARFQLLNRMPCDARDDPGDQPARLAHLNNGNQRAILIQSGERSAQVILLRHGAPRRFGSSDEGAVSSPLAP
jgi:hypothetical protein